MKFFTKEQFQILCPAFSMTRKEHLILLWKESDNTKTDKYWEERWENYKKSEFGYRMNQNHLRMLDLLQQEYGWMGLPRLE